MRNAIISTTAAIIALAGVAQAETQLKLVEVITSPERTEVLQSIVADFEEANPDVSVEIVSLPWGQAFEKLATMVAGGDRPDIVEMPGKWLSLYGANGELVDLQPYLSDWEHAGTLTNAAVDMGRLVNDTIYEIPYGFYLRAMFYNKNLLEEAGVSGPPRTMAEFMEASRLVSEMPGKSGYCMRGARGGLNGWLMMAAAMNGTNELFDADGNSRIDDVGSVEGLNFLIDMYQSGYAPRDSVNWGFNEIVAGFYSGTCAFLDQDPDALPAIASRMDAADFGVIPMPVGPDGMAFPTIGFAGWSMFESSENKDEAWNLIAELSSPESNLAWAKHVGVIPIHQGADEDPHFQSESFAGWFDTLKSENHVPTMMPTYLEQFGYFSSNLAVETSQNALLGNMTAQELAENWDEFLTTEYQSWASE